MTVSRANASAVTAPDPPRKYAPTGEVKCSRNVSFGPALAFARGMSISFSVSPAAKVTEPETGVKSALLPRPERIPIP